MDDRRLLEAVAMLDQYPAGTALPDDVAPITLPDSTRRMPMADEQMTVSETTETVTRPGRRWLAAVAAVVVVVAAGAAIMLVRPDGGDDVAGPGVDTTISAEVLADARAGDPASVAEVWWTAYWSGQTDLLREFSSPVVTEAWDPEAWAASSGFVTTFHGGEHHWRLESCEPNLGNDTIRCAVTSVGAHPVFSWQPGDQRFVSLRITDGTVVGVSAQAIFLNENFDHLEQAEAYDPDRYAAACSDRPFFTDSASAIACAALIREALGLSN